jgi:rhodanese-related sulfurtransferase
MAEEYLHQIEPVAAAALLRDDPRALLIDIRSSMEYLFVGHPVGAIHIPWIDEPDWVVSPDFIPAVRKLVLGGATQGANVPILLICRSGKRSAEAGKALLAAGFASVYNVIDGFEGELNEHHQRSTLGGWRFAGLPWEQC